MSAPTARRRIVRVTRSPKDACIWLISLECGHEMRLAQWARPRMESVHTVNGETVVGPRRILCHACYDIEESR